MFRNSWFQAIRKLTRNVKSVILQIGKNSSQKGWVLSSRAADFMSVTTEAILLKGKNLPRKTRNDRHPNYLIG